MTKKRNILVTGGAGFIGSHLVDELLQKGHKVIVVDNLSSGKKECVNKKAVFYKADILSSEIEKIFKKEKPEIVFHFAAHIEARESVKDPLGDAKVNILGSLNILENCRKYNVEKIIFASSGGEIYGDAKTIPTSEDYIPFPISPYGVAKFSVEKYLDSYYKVHGIKYVALRFGNVYGPGQNAKGESGVVAIFTEKMLRGEQPFIHGDGKQTKDYIFVDDVVQAAYKAFEKDFVGILNIGTGKETSVLEIFNKLKNSIGKGIEEKHIALPSINFKRGCLSIKKAKKVLDWQPKYNLNEGMEKTVAWFKKQ